VQQSRRVVAGQLDRPVRDVELEVDHRGVGGQELLDQRVEVGVGHLQFQREEFHGGPSFGSAADRSRVRSRVYHTTAPSTRSTRTECCPSSANGSLTRAKSRPASAEANATVERSTTTYSSSGRLALPAISPSTCSR